MTGQVPSKANSKQRETQPTERLRQGRILSRFYITNDGRLVVTDLWEALEKELVMKRGFKRE